MRKQRPQAPGFSNNEGQIAQMLRVDHAGEMAAVEIYKAQLKVFKNAQNSGNIENILAHQEQDEIIHKAEFDKILNERAIRPTILEPLWKPAAQFLGYSTALMSENAAHACTAAVEEVIENHYQDQEDALDDSDALKQTIKKFKEEEVAHKNDALEKGAQNAFAYPVIANIIKAGCKTAIALSHKI